MEEAKNPRRRAERKAVVLYGFKSKKAYKKWRKKEKREYPGQKAASAELRKMGND